ncbi:MAG TPA: ferrochelatase [Epsilonproteobacteria bacterium]|nr:ferrochelatase [Campylobacterota bacterium]
MKKAILLLNMGGPNNLKEVKLFLHNMFNDKRIIAAPKPIRWLVSKIIIAKRLKESQANYALLGGKSPLVAYTQKLIDKLQKKVDADVFMVMRYTPPFTKDIAQKLTQYEEIYAIPLYPHHSSTTTLSSFDDLFDEAKKVGVEKKIKSIDSYPTHPLYIQSIVQRIKEALGEDEASDYEVIFSAHGLPKKIIEKGDLYQKHIRQTLFRARKGLLLEGLNFANTHLAYQSRLGPLEWIRPYMDDKLHEFKGKNVIVFPIAFTIDNSETECELDIEYRHLANQIGIAKYKVAKAPNDNDAFVECLEDIYQQMQNDQTSS